MRLFYSGADRKRCCGGNGIDFGPYWAAPSKSRDRPRGRPALAHEIRQLILQMAAANPLWRAPRLHGELKILGIVVSERTVSRVLRTVLRPPSQTWKTFLKNHLSEIVSVDFFTVPTVRLRILFVFLALEHRRREVLHFNVTDHPASAWVAQQMMEAFGDRTAPRYLIRDRDGVWRSTAFMNCDVIGLIALDEILGFFFCGVVGIALERHVGNDFLHDSAAYAACFRIPFDVIAALERLGHLCAIT